MILLSVLFITLIWLSSTAADATPSPAAQRQDSLYKLLTIRWEKGPDLPTGFQDSDGGILNNTLLSVAGFCCGHDNIPGKPDKFPRGFKKDVYAFSLTDGNKPWSRLPDFPGAARQELFAAVVGSVLYCWGGFSYSEPFCYKDGFALSHKNNSWQWSPLPDLPHPLCSSGIAVIDSKIYILGGADYDSENFYTHHDRQRNIPRLGARLYVFDTQSPQSGWKELAPCPGTPRWICAAASGNRILYFLGGATGNDNPSKSYCTVVDNWSYDPASSQWRRLRDLPVASGNFPAGQILFDNRYIILIGGYQYPTVMNPDRSTRPTYGKAFAAHPDKPYYSDVWVYDTQTDLFGTADPLPLNNNLPMAVLEQNRIHLIGGETGSAILDGVHYPKHPDLYLIGTIEYNIKPAGEISPPK